MLTPILIRPATTRGLNLNTCSPDPEIRSRTFLSQNLPTCRWPHRTPPPGCTWRSGQHLWKYEGIAMIFNYHFLFSHLLFLRSGWELTRLVETINTNTSVNMLRAIVIVFLKTR